MPIRLALRPLLAGVASLVGLALMSPVVSPLAAQDSAAVVRALPPFDLHGFLEVYYRAGDPLTKDGYRLRKADIKFSGDVSPHIRWRVGFDGAKVLTLNTTIAEVGDSTALSGANIDQKSRILQDAALTYIVSRRFNIDVGQQVIPLGLEGGISTAQVETIERANLSVERSRAVGLGDVRDIGASVNGFATNAVEYHAGVFNETGDSQGNTDSNPQKAVIGRVVLHPSFVPHLQFGGSGAYEGGAPTQHRERAGGEIQYKDPIFTVRAEAIGARDGLLHRFGWYGLGAVRPTPRLQLVARYDAWDRDTRSELSIVNAFERQIVAGGSYLVDGTGARLVVNIVRQDFPDVTNVRSGTFLLAAFEASW
jgi:hypothetical protein